jgi:eukaryotic-like serine/threonine-protein kinase
MQGDNPMINNSTQQLGNYRLIRQLGSGSFADVYLGEHLYLKTQAAIKVMHTPMNTQDIQTFLKEAQTIAQLEHQNIVRVFDFGIDGSTPFLVMDYVPKGTLRQVHPRKSVLPLPLVISYVNQISTALQHAHDANVIHRDVKPENMLLNNRDEILLSDFGIAVAAHRTSSLKTLDKSGTPHYMAPEQSQGKPRPASDQYALGIVVYEWLCGTPPFHGELMQVLYQHAYTLPPSLREKVPTISVDVERVVLRALSKDPQQRYASVWTFAAALEEAARSELRGTTLCTYRGHRSRVLGLAWSPDGTRIVSIDDDKQIHFWDSSRGGTLPKKRVKHSCPGTIETLAWSPNGKHLAMGSNNGTLMVWEVASGGCIMRKDTFGRVEIVTWSPDSRCIASGSTGGHLNPDPEAYTVQVWDMQTGANLFTEPLHVPTRNGELFAFLFKGAVSIRWYADSRRMAFVSHNKIVEIWDIATHTKLAKQNDGDYSDEVNAVFWSPDGKYIAADIPVQMIEIWNATNRSVICRHYGDAGPDICPAWSPNSKLIASLSVEGAIQVWDATTGSNHFTYYDPSQSIGVIEWSLDGTRIASVNIDRNIRVWQAA